MRKVVKVMDKSKKSLKNIYLCMWIITSIILFIFCMPVIGKENIDLLLFVSFMIMGAFLALIELAIYIIIKGIKKLSEKLKLHNEISVETNKIQTNIDTDTPKPLLNATIQEREVPQQILQSMRFAYTSQQAVNDVRIFNESIAIMQKTLDIDTFFLRYENAMRCALTLEQAEKAGCIALNMSYSKHLLDIKERTLKDILYRSFQKELNEMNKLKTNNGKLNRINKYQKKLNDLYAREFEFKVEDTYNYIIQYLEDMKKELEK